MNIKKSYLINYIFIACFFQIIFTAVNSNSNTLHGISMHGIPKYKSDFTHLSYVNPEAPKGGTIRYGVYGSYDSLNRVSFKGSRAAGLGYVHDTLLRRVWDEAFSLYGLIAEKIEMPDKTNFCPTLAGQFQNI